MKNFIRRILPSGNRLQIDNSLNQKIDETNSKIEGYASPFKRFLRIFFKRQKSWERTVITFLKIPIYKRTIKDFVERKYFCGIRYYKEYRFGDLYWNIINEIGTQRDKLFNYLDWKRDEIFARVDWRTDEILKQIDWHKNNVCALEQQSENVRIAAISVYAHQYLKKYQNMYAGKDIVIVSPGPTAKYLDYDPEKIYIGVRRAFKNPEIKFDYLFWQDLPLSGFEEMKEFEEYVGNDCQKFIGILPNWHQRVHPDRLKNIPWLTINKSKANLYYLESICRHNWAYDISVEPFGEFYSTVFSAFQFALYTHPKRIYLAGCDCSGGYFFDPSHSNSDYDELVDSWKMAKGFASTIYPDTEIISVNPVGLKGLFKDEYTEAYLKAQTE